jgi:hypothetical protein
MGNFLLFCTCCYLLGSSQVRWGGAINVFLDLEDFEDTIDVAALLGESECFGFCFWIIWQIQQLVDEVIVRLNFGK